MRKVELRQQYETYLCTAFGTSTDFIDYLCLDLYKFNQINVHLKTRNVYNLNRGSCVEACAAHLICLKPILPTKRCPKLPALEVEPLGKLLPGGGGLRN